jgi:glucans biosynthesis protein
VRSTRQSVEGAAAGRTRFIVDFAGSSLEALAPDAIVDAEISASAPASATGHGLIRNEYDGSWRLSAEFSAPPGSQPCDLTARLTLDGQPVTETWQVRWKP